MRVAPIIIGSVIGGLVFVFGVRATSAAARDAKPAAGGPPPPTDTPPVRDKGGSSTETPPFNPNGSGPGGPATTIDVITAAATIPETTTILVDHPAGTDGNTGTVMPMKVDPVTATIKPDDEHPQGGQGVEQQSPAVINAAQEIPSYANGAAPYEDYIKARLGSTNGLTPAQVSAYIREAARIGGLAL